MFYYVSRYQGNNDNDGLTPETALKTIVHAKKIAKKGDQFKLVEKNELMTCLRKGVFHREPVDDAQATKTVTDEKMVEMERMPVTESDSQDTETAPDKPVGPEADERANVGLMSRQPMTKGAAYPLRLPIGDFVGIVEECTALPSHQAYQLRLSVPVRVLDWMTENGQTISRKEAVESLAEDAPVDPPAQPQDKSSYAIHQHRIGQVLDYRDRPGVMDDRPGTP